MIFELILLIDACSKQNYTLEDGSALSDQKSTIKEVLKIDNIRGQKIVHDLLTEDEKADGWTYKLSSTIEGLKLKGERRSLLEDLLNRLFPKVFAANNVADSLIEYVNGEEYRRSSAVFTAEELV